MARAARLRQESRTIWRTRTNARYKKERAIARCSPDQALVVKVQLAVLGRYSRHPQGDRRLRFDRVDKAGRVTLRRRGRLHHIDVGRPYAGWWVAMLLDGLDIEIVGVDGSPLRRLVLDPTKDYQRIP
jgi:hypothetical protein